MAPAQNETGGVLFSALECWVICGEDMIKHSSKEVQTNHQKLVL